MGINWGTPRCVCGKQSIKVPGKYYKLLRDVSASTVDTVGRERKRDIWPYAEGNMDWMILETGFHFSCYRRTLKKPCLPPSHLRYPNVVIQISLHCLHYPQLDRNVASSTKAAGIRQCFFTSAAAHNVIQSNLQFSESFVQNIHRNFRKFGEIGQQNIH
eukprot:g57359.t1